ncbi:TetR/AcrR family transcriptional regulator [Marinomonas sp. 2405UD68-3]|uniref:TetR/AcrR family transcriptional regulator n=1 Tax=Marinomonas sp. 2405UD68-3 TaxID=3391835 RepID=UPI0039C917EC
MAKKGFDRLEVIDNAIELFWRHGYTASSVQLITQYTGLKPGSLYNEFGNKEGLFNEALQRYAESTIQMIHTTMNEEQDVKKAVLRILDESIQASTECGFCGCFLIKTQLELGAQDNPLYELALNKLNEIERTYQHYLTQEFDESKSIECARQVMMMVFSIQIYGYKKNVSYELSHSIRSFLPWL